MITIIHGQNIVASRQYLVDLLEKSRQEGQQILPLTKSDQTVEKVTQALGGTDLFGFKSVLLLENYLKQKTGKTPDAFQKYLNESPSNIFLWEEDQRSPTAISSFPKAKVFEFRVPSSVFKFLDAIRPGNPKLNVDLYHQALIGSSAEMIFSLLARRFVDILSPSTKLADWQKFRLKSQSQLFSPIKLTKAIKDLLEIDISQKTSASPLSLSSEIEIFLFRL